MNGKKYARIALGNKTNSFSEVNKKFRCIIIVDQDKIPEQEIPFLNRFEKQNISFEYLMNDKQISIANKLYEKYSKMIMYDENKIKLVNYVINDLLINYEEEEILGFVYMETQGKGDINEEEYEIIENNFISKIGNLLPQDIILILLFNEQIWDNNNNNFYNKLLEYYDKNVHNNLKDFLINYDNKTNKIILYTFTNIIEPIYKENLYFYNIKSLGKKIKENNVKQIRISSIQNEFELETEIDDFLENKNYYIFIIKLQPFECYTIDYLKTIIENKETEYENKIQEKINKLFIFIIHLERIKKKDSVNQYSENWDLIRKKILTRTLSNLAGNFQIFIDDINGKDYYDNEKKIITLDRILKMKNKDLYKSFIDVKNIILQNFDKIFFFYDYTFNYDENKLNKEIYINNLFELFIEDEHLLKLIDEKIMENINNENFDDNNKNILEKVIKEEKFSRADICIYDIIKKILNKNYLNEFKILYIELEKNYYFSNLILKKKETLGKDNIIVINEDLDRTIKEIFISNVDINKKIPEDEMKFNIIVGFNLPSKNLIEEISSKINNNIISQYRENEEEFKDKYFEKEDEEFRESLIQYENNLELYTKITKENIMKNNIIKEIQQKNGKGLKKKFYNLLLDDYLLTFIDKNFSNLKNDIMVSVKSFLKIIISHKFNLTEYNNIDLSNLSAQLNWIESYSIEIISIIKIYIFLNSNNKNPEEINKKIQDVLPKLNKEYTNLKITNNVKKINGAFYNIIGSLINILISDLNIFLSEVEDQENLNVLLNKFNSIYYSLLSINNNLNLNSKEIFILHEAIKTISILSFNESGEDLEKNKKILIDFIQKEIINENKEEEDNLKNKIKKEKEKNEIDDTEEEKSLKNKLNNFYNYYKEKNDINNINFASLFSSVLFDEFNKEFNEKYRQHILKTILDDKNLIPHNTFLIKIILSEIIKPDKDIIADALDYILGEKTYFPLLNKYDMDIVNKIIMNVFETTINLYFKSLEKLEEHIVSDLFNIFEEYLKVIADDKYKKYYKNYYNENIVKIYVLSFIRIYLNNFVSLVCREKSSLKGKEEKIINEIAKDYAISNTIKLYFIILLYDKTKSLNLLRDKLYESIETFSIDLMNEIGKNDFYNILNNSTIPKNDKYLFNEFFNYIEYPSFQNFKSKFLFSNENKEKYPLINEYIKNESGAKNLKYLTDYNNFINLMINYYSGKISRNEANLDRNLNLEEIYKKDENNFRNMLDKFKFIYNNILSEYIKNINDKELNSMKFLDKLTGNEKLAYFLIDNDDKGYGIFIAKGLNQFIKWQNSFLIPIIKAYKGKKNNIISCYVSQMEKEIDIQKANYSQILQIENCFDRTFFINFDELLSLYSGRNNDNLNDFKYNFEKIEEELGKCLLTNKCLFNEKNINYICYQNEGFRNINYDYLIKFEKKYGTKELTEEERKKIFIYSSKEFNNFDILNDSFILLVNHLNNNTTAKNDTKIIDFIKKEEKRYINFNNQFINYFNEDGKEIVIQKLLNSFLYMEHICYEHLIEQIDEKFKTTFDEGQKREIKKYFNFTHNDPIITKKEISTAVRRFIIRYLLNDDKKERIDPNLSLYIYLERKYLWNNKIFSLEKDNFNELIKKYLGSFSFSLETKHALEFYNIIGEEEKNLIKEEKRKFAGKEIRIGDNIKIDEQKKVSPKILNIGGRRPIKKGGKMKNEK